MIHENIGLGKDFEDIWSRTVDGYDPYIHVGMGWAGLIKECHKALYSFDPNYRIYQIKEKFGGLRYYVRPSIDALVYKTNAIINPFEKRSYLICEICGQNGNLRRKNGMYRTLCVEHGPESDGFISASASYP